jgi:uracil-DNA glycosylase
MLDKYQISTLTSAMGVEWFKALERSTLSTPAFEKLGKILATEYSMFNVYPKDLADVFRAFTATPISKVNVVIIGQNPYHSKDIADGLAFSCSHSKYPQPSLKNILIEIEKQIYHEEKDLLLPEFYSLFRWAEQGVFLLNSALTVREGEPDSHIDMWKFFTVAVIEALSRERKEVVYLLWGRVAQAFDIYIDPISNYILKCGHPMTKTYQGRDTWSNNGHFIETNNILKDLGKPEITW